MFRACVSFRGGVKPWKWDKLPTSTGDRRISEPSTVFLDLRLFDACEKVTQQSSPKKMFGGEFNGGCIYGYNPFKKITPKTTNKSK